MTQFLAFVFVLGLSILVFASVGWGAPALTDDAGVGAASGNAGAVQLDRESDNSAKRLRSIAVKSRQNYGQVGRNPHRCHWMRLPRHGADV